MYIYVLTYALLPHVPYPCACPRKVGFLARKVSHRERVFDERSQHSVLSLELMVFTYPVPVHRSAAREPIQIDLLTDEGHRGDGVEARGGLASVWGVFSSHVVY